MYNHLYLGLDAHTRTCTLASINDKGKVVTTKTFSTSEYALIDHIRQVPAKKKSLMLEESSLAGWLTRTLRPHVDTCIVCDPQHNALISRGNKNDIQDAVNLGRLLRLGEYVEVYHSQQDHRIDFKIFVKHYLNVRDDCARVKSQIKAKFHQAGILDVTGTKVFSPTHREAYLRLLPTENRKWVLNDLYKDLDAREVRRNNILEKIKQLGSGYPEIQQFMRIPGVGLVGASVFSAFIGTPYRFGSKQQIWKYCQLGIRERSSGGKPLGYKSLDRSGSGALKSVSYLAWLSSNRTKEPNEVSSFYEASLQRTRDHTHARLNTQRKLLTVMWTVWKNDVDYDPDQFYRIPVIPVNAQTT